jgi:hypothetical protein
VSESNLYTDQTLEQEDQAVAGSEQAESAQSDVDSAAPGADATAALANGAEPGEAEDPLAEFRRALTDAPGNW